jgi:RNA 3'-terminal phosphate cyclase (ATP)
VPDHLPIVLDGGDGDGGGQRLRTALALSCITGRPFSTSRFRASRPEPGLRPAQLQVVRAAAALCDAALEGDEVGAERLSFAPRRPVKPVDGLALDAGPGGPTALLLQTICWPLALAGGPSTLLLQGTTHQPQAPTFHELALVWAPAAARLGFTVELSLGLAGFPGGGPGQVTARVEPGHAMPPLDLRHRGTLRDVEVLSFTGGSEPADQRQAERQAHHAVRALRALGVAAEAERLPVPVQGAGGTALLLVASFERAHSGHGAVAAREPGGADPAEAAVASLRAHLSGGAGVDALLADQLLLPAALLAAGLVPPAPGVVPASRWSVAAVTPHLLDVAAVIPRFLAVEVAVLGRPGEPGEVRVAPAGASPDVLPLRHEGDG